MIGIRVRQMWVQVPALPFISTVALLKFLNLCESQFPYFQIGVNNTCSVIRLTGDNGE